jgi:hypothetical protein
MSDEDGESHIELSSADGGQPRKPTKKDLLKAFKADLSAADTLRQETVACVETWRDEYHGRPYGNEQDGKSKIVSRDIKRQDEWQHASVKDPFVADEDIIKASPVSHEDRKAAQQNELVLNHQFCRQFNRYKFMTDVIKLYYAEGTVVVKCSWHYEDEEVDTEIPVWGTDPYTGLPVQIDTRTVKKLKIISNRPDATICRLEDIYLDPTSEGDLDKSNFVIHRYESDISTLRKSKKYKNLDKLARSISGSENEPDYDPEDESEFKFQDEPRKKIVVHEYWGLYDVEGTGIATPIVCTWVNDIIIQLESNPYPDQGLPFLVLANNSIPFKLYGEANAELIGDNQKINTAIKRGILDNMANSNNAQKGMRVGSMDPLNKRRFLNGKNFEYNGSKADFFEGSYNQIPGSVFNVMEMTNNETESMLGVKAFANGGIAGSSLGSTAKAAGGVLDAVSVRRSDIVRNIAENLIKPLMRKWTSYNSEFLRPEETIRITNDEFVQVKRDDLAGFIDIKIKVSTAEDNSNKAQELAFLLQTLGQTMEQGMRNMLMAEIARLNKMPDLAKSMENYKPEPDPFTERMKELEIKEKEANIIERMSRAAENKVDIRLKNANAALAEAKTRQLGSDTDLKDLDFTRKADGTEHNEEMQKKAFDHGATIAHEQEKQKGKPLTR